MVSNKENMTTAIQSSEIKAFQHQIVKRSERARLDGKAS
jgi:hypothetical protein